MAKAIKINGKIAIYKQRRFYILLFLALVTTIILSIITDVFDVRSRAMESLSAIGGGSSTEIVK